MRIYDSQLREANSSHLLLGHSLNGADKRYDFVKWVDAPQRSKTEAKKAKQLVVMRDKINSIVDDRRRKRRIVQFEVKRCRDACSMAVYSRCGRERMIEIDFCGRALRSGLLTTGGNGGGDDQLLLACCGCLTRVSSQDVKPIGEIVVCGQCYDTLRQTGGTVTQRTARGESTKSVSTSRVGTTLATDETDTEENESVVARLARVRRMQEQLSPSWGALSSDMVPIGTPCIMDRCKTFKTSENRMFGLEVLQDVDVGNETFGYIYMCANHARMYSSAFKVPYRLSLSTVRNYMVTGRKDFDQVAPHGAFLDDIMRRGAELNAVGAQVRAKNSEAAQRRRHATQAR